MEEAKNLVMQYVHAAADTLMPVGTYKLTQEQFKQFYEWLEDNWWLAEDPTGLRIFVPQCTIEVEHGVMTTITIH